MEETPSTLNSSSSTIVEQRSLEVSSAAKYAETRTSNAKSGRRTKQAGSQGWRAGETQEDDDSERLYYLSTAGYAFAYLILAGGVVWFISTAPSDDSSKSGGLAA